MHRFVLLLTCLALCESHAVVPVVAPLVHAVPAPYSSLYLNHGYSGVGYGDGYIAKPLGHHILRRSPHIVPIGKYDHVGAASGLGYIGGIGHAGHLAVVAPVAVPHPVAVSHQARVDVRTSPAVVTSIGHVAGPIYANPAHHGIGYEGLGYYGSAHGHY